MALEFLVTDFQTTESILCCDVEGLLGHVFFLSSFDIHKNKACDTFDYTIVTSSMARI